MVKYERRKSYLGSRGGVVPLYTVVEFNSEYAVRLISFNSSDNEQRRLMRFSTIPECCECVTGLQ
jgi:hypothetical protein